MDLYSRAITGLRLSPVSTKSVDAALVLFEALRPGSRQHTSGGLLPYAGLPDLVAVGDGTAGLAGVAAETIVVDYADPPVMPTETQRSWSQVCQDRC